MLKEMMTSAASLDTSGAICVPPRMGVMALRYTWSDLDPFTQGYVEEMLRPREATYYSLTDRFAGFSDLAPETLAAILKDSAKFLKGCEGTRVWGFASDGRLFWEGRQRGHMPANYPPLIVYLGDDGKVRTRPSDATA